ncbi:MAG: isoprenyl transferase [Candidatus Omnitrophota bacterium]
MLQHVAIIMDGNGRWAERRHLPKLAGHRAGVKAAEQAIEGARELGIKVLTLYTFSTENWKRPKREIEGLFMLLDEYLDREADKFNKNNIRFSVIGRIDALPQATQVKLEKMIRSTKDNTGLILNLALNYGSRTEMIDAVRSIAADVAEGKTPIGSIDEKLFSRNLYTKDLPDPDLMIRTSGESRISNFLLWQLSYSELYFMKKLWPDFKKSDLKKAVSEYGTRERRFGA